MDHSGWYNRKELVFFQVVDLLIAGCMGIPGGGRTFITERAKATSTQAPQLPWMGRET